MKKLKYLLLIMLFCLTGCIKSNSMDDIKIVTSAYPIEYVVKTLYGNHYEGVYFEDSFCQIIALVHENESKEKIFTDLTTLLLEITMKMPLTTDFEIKEE